MRFTEYLNSGYVRLSLRPGQVLLWTTGRVQHEEGWTRETREWSMSSDGLTVRSVCAVDGRDCDGFTSSTTEFECPVEGLDMRRVDMSEYGEGVVFLPDWRRVDAYCRDEYAEMAGY